MDLRALLTLEEVAKDFYLGQTPAYEWGRVYGGQVVAQGLAAAGATVSSPAIGRRSSKRMCGTTNARWS